MSNNNIYKPRYTLAFIAKSKTWPYKDSFLRRLYAIRSTRVRRGGLFRRFVLRATSIKWTEARRFFHPLKRHQVSTPIHSSSVGFGRLIKPKFNYRESFYRKQQLRFFHGKIKEQAFRQFFQTHISSIANQSKSFFASLESRLDIVFFRRRLLPTIYACHQFIHYNGIEKNGKKESAPSTLVDVSDIVSVPQKVWIIFYSRVFTQVYYRRWGLFTTRQRILTSFKKVFSKLQYNYRKQNTFIQFYSGYNKYKKNFKFNIKSSKLAMNFMIIAQNNKVSLANSILSKDQTFSKRSTTASKLYKWKTFRSFSTSLANWAKASPYNKRMYTFSGIRMPIVNQGLFEGPYSTIASTYFKKRQHYQKLLMSLRLRNSNIVRFTKIKKKGSNLLQIYKKRAKKSKRFQGTPRLKDVHFYIPAHLQIDFRTLRVIKLKAPLLEETYYPFRISLPKVYSFYRIKGF